MPIFAYKARTRAGQPTEGTVEGRDRREALAAIERLGHVPISVTEGATRTARSTRGRFFSLSREPRMAPREVLVFTTELSDLLASGMTLGNALNSLSRRESGKGGDVVIPAVRDEIVRGASLSDALAQHPRSFTDLYVSMIRAGEASGALSEVLNRLVEHYERLQDVKEKVVMALTYPMIVIVMGIGTLVFSMLYVIPKFESVFQQMEQALPLPTRILIGGSSWVVKYGLFVLIAGVLAGILLNRAIKTERGRLTWDGLKLKVPLIRGIVASSIFANLARTLGTLMKNGVPVLEALRIVERTVGNTVVGRELRDARDRVTDGTTISGPLAAGGVFPVLMTDMLAVGEQTGDMTGALSHIARRYERELDRNVKVFTTALEPILIVLVAVMVGFVAVSILMAVFNLSSGLSV